MTTTPHDLASRALALLKQVSTGPQGHEFTAAEVRHVIAEEALYGATISGPHGMD
jgi:hypothetical protein